MKITKRQLKQFIKEELSKVMNESMPGMEPYDLSTLVKKNLDPDKRDAAEQAGYDDFHAGKGSDPDDEWEGTEYYEFYMEAYEHEDERSQEGRM